MVTVISVCVTSSKFIKNFVNTVKFISISDNSLKFKKMCSKAVLFN